MSRMRIAAALALAALLVPAAAEARAETKLVIKVTSVSVSMKTVDTAPKGKVNKGDKIVYRDNLLNAAAQFGKKKGVKVGTDSGTMSFGNGTATFDGTARLPGGTLRLKGQVYQAPDGKSLVIPVAGGTGRFAGARGTVLVGPGAKRSLNTYTLQLPDAPVA
jgi:hypothetical protein